MTKVNEARRYAGKVAFVSGAGSGIGRATALAFAREGASVLAADIAEQGNQETGRLIEQIGTPVRAVRCDVTRGEDVRAALDVAMGAFGRLDVAFNNAGIEQPVAALADLSEDLWDRILSVNLRSVFLCMKYQIPLMIAGGGGAIVNTASGAGVLAIGVSPPIARRSSASPPSARWRRSTMRRPTSASTRCARGSSTPR